jgi:hypothetical protein
MLLHTLSGPNKTPFLRSKDLRNPLSQVEILRQVQVIAVLGRFDVNLETGFSPLRQIRCWYY